MLVIFAEVGSVLVDAIPLFKDGHQEKSEILVRGEAIIKVLEVLVDYVKQDVGSHAKHEILVPHGVKRDYPDLKSTKNIAP